MFRFSPLSSPLGLFLTGIGISLAGAFLFAFILQLPSAGGLAYLLLALLLLIVVLVVVLLSIHIKTIDEAEQSIQEQSSELSSILSSIGEGLLVVDSDRRITLLNPVAMKLLGYTAASYGTPLKLTLSFFKHSAALPSHAWPILEALQSKKTVKTILYDGISLKGALNTFPVVGSAAPLADTNGTVFGAVWVFRDASAEKQIDEHKTEFVSLASHQLKTPLTIINWYCELLLSKKNSSLSKELRDLLKRIESGGKRMVSLVNELLVVTQIEEGRMRPSLVRANLSHALKAVIDECDPLIKEYRGSIVFVKPSKAAYVKLDHMLFSQAVSNIILNAVKYATDHICRIEIKANYPQKGTCALQIHDKGIGIPDDAKEHVFEKFYRAKNAIESKTEGSGLGLYIAKRFCELMGSGLTFESRKDTGTTFTIIFPVA